MIAVFQCPHDYLQAAMYRLACFALSLTSVVTISTAADCVCTSAIKRGVYNCADRNYFRTNLYADYYDDPCMLAAPEVVVASDWKAGILEGQVLYRNVCNIRLLGHHPCVFRC